MLLNSYLRDKFAKELLVLSIFFAFFILAVQLFNNFHLLFSLSLWLSAVYLALNVIYTLYLSVAFSLFLVLANILYDLKEKRIFHILFTFGVSEKGVMVIFWRSILILTLIGAFVSPIVNYQKVAQLTKYLKVKFGERILLAVPPKSFLTAENFAVYFGDRKGATFKGVVIKTETDTATAAKAQLKPNGVLVLSNCSLFSERKNLKIFMRSDKYLISLGYSYDYTPKVKRM